MLKNAATNFQLVDTAATKQSFTIVSPCS